MTHRKGTTSKRIASSSIKIGAEKNKLCFQSTFKAVNGHENNSPPLMYSRSMNKRLSSCGREKKTNHMSRRIVISARDARSQWTTKNVFVDVLLPAYFFARSFHGLCLKRAEQVDDERVFDHGHDLFFCLHMFHLWAKTKASSTMRVSCEAHECSLRNFLRTVTPQFWNVGFLAQSM